MNRDTFGRALAAAQADMAENPSLTGRRVHKTKNRNSGVPHRSTTAASGYVSMKAKYPSRCASCRTRIKEGTQVRYWFGDGVTCRRCTLPETRTRGDRK